MANETNTVYLGLGTNLGDRESNINRALDMMSQRLRLGAVSSVYETEPEGKVNQPHFLNQVIQAFTRLSPQDLLALAKGIELKLGRTGGSGEPRPIDIDILFYGDLVMDTPELIIPHSRLAERAFALVPLAEIAPGLMHPVLGKTIRDLLQAITEVQGVLKLDNGRA
ncbi:MAG: 2-amino-4-hydroxy-6-hydroxymethyldihydropteridine diphosphokinase [Dehalococcoidales bacterium]|jgi:2-amino-4-hydroxy-6-hydroxymethyldihydropteridine diphosphokinase